MLYLQTTNVQVVKLHLKSQSFLLWLLLTRVQISQWPYASTSISPPIVSRITAPSLLVQFSPKFFPMPTLGGMMARSVITSCISDKLSLPSPQLICSEFLRLCPLPTTSPLDLSGWFSKPKPNPLPPLKKPTGQRLKVLHLSDLHIDPREMLVMN